MNPKDREIAQKLKKKLSEFVPLLDFRILGSRARGDEDEYSNLDVFMEVEEIDKDLKERIFDTVWEVGFEHLIVISALVFTRDEVENSPLRASPFLKNIAEDGVAI